MAHYYFIIPHNLIESMQGYEVDSKVFNAVQDIQERWVCSINSVIEFPELFAGHSFQVVELTNKDFPKLESIL
jgi:hypothetical protein